MIPRAVASPAILLFLALNAARAATPVELPHSDDLSQRLVLKHPESTTEFVSGDLDGDRRPELLVRGKDSPDHPSLWLLKTWKNWRGFTHRQFNFPSLRGGVAGLGDCDDDGRAEMLVWEHPADSMRLHILDPASSGGISAFDTLLTSPWFPARVLKEQSSWLGRIESGAVYLPDVNSFVTTVVQGFGLKPRAILFMDCDTGDLDLIPTGPNYQLTDQCDIDRDGHPELFFLNTAPSNGNAVDDEDDLHSYWRVMNSMGRDLLHEVAGSEFSVAATFPLRDRSADKCRILALASDRTGGTRMKVFGAQGQLRKVLSLSKTLAGVTISDWNADGTDEIIVGYASGELTIFKQDLQPIHTWSFPAPVKPIQLEDFNGNGRKELLLVVGNRLWLLDGHMRPLATLGDHILGDAHSLQNFKAGKLLIEQNGDRGLYLRPPGGDLSGFLTLENVSLRQQLSQRLLPMLALSFLAGALLVAACCLIWLRTRGGRVSLPAAENSDLATCEGSLWRDLLVAVRDFRHSGSGSRNLNTLAFLLDNLDSPTFESLRPRLLDASQLFLDRTSRAISAMESQAAGLVWDAVEQRDCISLRLALEKVCRGIIDGGPESIDRDLALSAISGLEESVDSVLGRIESRINCELGFVIDHWTAGRKRGEFDPILNISIQIPPGICSGEVVICPDDLEILLGFLLEFHRSRLDGVENAAVDIEFVWEREHLLVTSSDNGRNGPLSATRLEAVVERLAEYQLSLTEEGGQIMFRLRGRRMS